MPYKVLSMDNDSSVYPGETLREIKDMMQRSSRFLSLSGWSGIWAGAVALAGALAAGYLLRRQHIGNHYLETDFGTSYKDIVLQLSLLAIVVFLLALAGGIYFTWQKNRQSGVKLWGEGTKKLLFNLFIPLFAGGVVCIAFISRYDWLYIAPMTLIFYGLALINASKYTYSDIRYLGILEMLIGFAGLAFPGYGLWLWAAGFGILHIVYGILMWNKYDRG